MPKQLTKNIYKCVYCGKEFDNEEVAKRHESNDHDIIFIELERTDLNRLVNFIATKEDSLITERLRKTLLKYFRGGMSSAVNVRGKTR